MANTDTNPGKEKGIYSFILATDQLLYVSVKSAYYLQAYFVGCVWQSVVNVLCYRQVSK